MLRKQLIGIVSRASVGKHRRIDRRYHIVLEHRHKQLKIEQRLGLIELIIARHNAALRRFLVRAEIFRRRKDALLVIRNASKRDGVFTIWIKLQFVFLHALAEQSHVKRYAAIVDAVDIVRPLPIIRVIAVRVACVEVLHFRVIAVVLRRIDKLGRPIVRLHPAIGRQNPVNVRRRQLTGVVDCNLAAIARVIVIVIAELLDLDGIFARL